ncbi:hypothetical protein B0J17DRAFT_263148 [Rhizoctonia solani]|nr:hypothetical protein B0J17DRAFT_263148 [Rhizoctonia solani]
MSIWLATLPFFDTFLNAAGAKYTKGAREYSTPKFASGANNANPHDSVNIYFHYTGLECFSHRSGQKGFLVWSGCFVYTVLWSLFVLWYALRWPQEQLPQESKERPTRHRVGRTLPIATACQSGLPDDSDVSEDSPAGTPRTTSTIQVPRGKRFASQRSDLSQPHTTTNPILWDLKEPCPVSNRRQVWMSSLVIEPKSDLVDQERK